MHRILTLRVVLATMAENVMTHYENMREKQDRKRVLHMNMCLAAFVDPEHQIKRRKRRRDSQSSAVLKAQKPQAIAGAEGADNPRAGRGSRRKPSIRSSPSPVSNHDSDAPSEDTASTVDRRVEEDDHIETFKRAANLLHTSLGLDGGGGVAFMDTTTSYRSVSQRSFLYQLPVFMDCTTVLKLHGIIHSCHLLSAFPTLTFPRDTISEEVLMDQVEEESLTVATLFVVEALYQPILFTLPTLGAHPAWQTLQNYGPSRVNLQRS